MEFDEMWVLFKFCSMLQLHLYFGIIWMVLTMDREYLSLQLENHRPDLKGHKVDLSDSRFKLANISTGRSL